MIVAIEGGIGAGKTTTATLLSQKLDAALVLEKTEAHPFLNAFYDDPSRFALETELGFVLLHYHQLHPIDTGGLVVTDFSPVKDLAFARMNLGGAALELFEHVYERLTSTLPPPTLAIYLDLELNAALSRIRLRDRPYERAITIGYLERLRDAYFGLLSHLAAKVERIEISATDPPQTIVDRVLRIVQNSRLLGQ
jgi:deoxyguanosine kinase